MIVGEDGLIVMDLSFFLHNILVLEKAFDLLLKSDRSSMDYEIYCSACVKKFELILDLSVSLLDQYIKSSGRSVIMLVTHSPRDIYRSAAGLGSPLPLTASKRWIKYQEIRDNNNFGCDLTDEMFSLLPKFIKDANALAKSLQISYL